jgi:hypothetical protein
VTTPTTKRFQWIDRDTAAHDLLQLVYHAPSSIRSRAIRLLSAIRSPVVIPALQAIFYDKQYSSTEREDALNAIIETSGDVYMPELLPHLTAFKSSMFYVFDLADKHPSNRAGLFEYIEQLSPKELCDLISIYIGVIREGIAAPVCNRLLDVLDTNPHLLDIRIVRKLRKYDKRESTQEWLAARWKTLVYLCLIEETRQLVHFLEDWEELRNIVFFSCPTIVIEYHPVRAAIEAQRMAQQKTVDITKAELWQDLSKLHAQALDGDKDSVEKLIRYLNKRDILTSATAIHFLGKLPLATNYLKRLLFHIRHTDDAWKCEDVTERGMYFIHHPLRFEVGEILRDHPSPEIWQTLIDSYLTINYYPNFMLDWISYQTDILSGLDVPYTGKTWKPEARPWFQALATQTDTESNREL